ncbi:MAG: carboxypeptidase regulatory-like domain-containing protein [Acidobacteriota bacterium]
MLNLSFKNRLLTFVVAFALMPAHLFAQSRTDATIRVSVLDPTGAAIASAKVRVKSKTGVERVAETNDKGEAVIAGLKPGRYQVTVEAEGFTAKEFKDHNLRAGNNRISASLEVAGINEVEVVSEDKAEKASDPRAAALTNTLTPEQIAKLPDDPEEMEQALKQMAGPGATLRVNGFAGGRLPPKNQIREIRFKLNPFAAESHEASFFGIDIITKPGIDTWHSSLNLGFRDESLNARNPFAPVEGPEQNRRYSLTLDGPIARNRSSLFLSADGFDNYDSKTIVAALADGNLNEIFRRPSRKLDLAARVEHALTKTHTSRFEYQRNALRQDNLGAGDFDLLERAYAADRAEHIFRFADTGALGKKLVNEFRFQARWQRVENVSASRETTLSVLNAFTAGGAQIEGGRRECELEIADNMDFVASKHSMRSGILFETARYTSDENRNITGTFTFASLDAFRQQRPTLFSRRAGDPRVEFDQHQFAWYWQDDWRVTKSLTLSYGIRHEVQTNLEDKNNFAPRVGVAWSPFKDGKTTIRAGAGIFYDWFAAPIFEQTLKVDGRRQRDIVIQNPCYPDPLGCGSQIILPPSRIQVADSLRMPYVAQASIGVQRELFAGAQLRANYFHQRGYNLLRGRNVNAPLDGKRPDPTAGNITEIQSVASSTSHSLMIGLNFNNMKRRILASINYLLSKATNEADSPFSLPADNFDTRAERGPAITDARHRVFGLFNMQLFYGLSLGTLFNYSSATPYNVTTGFDDNRDSVINDRPRGTARNSARGAGQWTMSARLGWGFGFGKRPEANAQGGTPRLVRINGGDSDVPAMSGLGANKRYRWEFYTQATNVFNHTNRVNFAGVQTSPFFGQATAALPGRRIEVGTRFGF